MSKKFAYFFDPQTGWKGWGLLLLSCVASIVFIGCIAWMTCWNTIFWDAITTMNMPLFIEQLWGAVEIMIGMSVAWFINGFSINKLTNDWRAFMTKSLLDEYLPDEDALFETTEKNDFVDIARSSQTLKAPAQRIQEDVQRYVDGFLGLSIGLIQSVLQLSSSVAGLWIIGGALSFLMFGTPITIPGYLVWAAVLFSGLATAITHWISNSLNALKTVQKNKEGELRQELLVLQEESEFIAQENGRAYYRNALKQKVNDVRDIDINIGQLNTKTSVFKIIYQTLAPIFPVVVASPLYFSGFFQLGMFMQVSTLFTQVNTALDWFVNSSDLYYDFLNASNRLEALDKAFLPQGLGTTPKQIQRQRDEANHELKLEGVQVRLPHQGKCIIGPLNFTVTERERVLISGDNGTGKSTLLKVIQGSWRYGQGKITAPRDMMILSQKPHIPHRTLRAVLAYPYEPERYQSEDYRQVLIKVGLEGYTVSLDDQERLDWSTTLNGGAQQQIGFARILLHKPKWVGLDEATAALTVNNEQKMYELLTNELPDSTILSIGHRPGIRAYHNRHLFFSKLTEKDSAILTHDAASYNDGPAVNDQAYEEPLASDSGANGAAFT